MPADYLQNIRYKLQKRVRRLNGAEWDQFIYLLRQFWVYVDSNPQLVGVIAQLTTQYPDFAESAEKIMAQNFVVARMKTKRLQSLTGCSSCIRNRRTRR